MKSINLLILFIAAWIILSNSSCKTKCTAPSIALPSGSSANKAPAEKFHFDIAVTGTDNDIYSIIVSKTANGVTTASFLSLTGISSKSKTVTLTDSVQNSPDFNSTIVYTIKATSDCKTSESTEKTYTVTIAPSPLRLDDSVRNSAAPLIYNRFTSNATYNKSWNLQGKAALTDTARNSIRDIVDSAIAANPFTTATWGSRNGSLFKKANSLNYAQVSPEMIYNAWNSGAAGTNLINIAPNDLIIVNIRNTNRFALVKIRAVVDDGTATNDDYTLFEYKLAQN